MSNSVDSPPHLSSCEQQREELVGPGYDMMSPRRRVSVCRGFMNPLIVVYLIGVVGLLGLISGLEPSYRT